MKKSVLYRFVSTNTWLKLTSLLLAVGLWFFVVSQGHSVIDMEIPIGFKNLPDHLEVLEGQKMLSVSIKGQERLLKKLRQGDVNAALDLSNVKKGNIILPLTTENITLPNSLSVIDISPQTVKLKLEEKITKRVPVKSIIVGAPSPGYVVSRIEVTPSLVEIKGIESVITKTYSVKTEPVDISGISGNNTYNAYLDTGSIKVNIPEVEVSVSIIEAQ
jgi:YbbR domain-containing protein